MSLYDLVAERAGHRCEYCHAPEVLFNHRFPVDHIVPRIHGGSGGVENLALACHSCNGRKYKKRMGMDTARRKLTRLFNPRQDKWEEHFHWRCKMNQPKKYLLTEADLPKARYNIHADLLIKKELSDLHIH